MAGSEHELKKKPKLTEEMVTEVTLSELEKNPEGITKYPILEFDERALRLVVVFLHKRRLFFSCKTLFFGKFSDFP